MSGKPLATNTVIRQLIREVLAMAPGYGFSDAALCRAVKDLLPDNATDDVTILEEAVWNLGMDYVETRKNEDTEEREWKITKHGIAKANLK